MKLKYLTTLIPQQDKMAPVAAISCALNMRKVAIATSDRSIALLDDKNVVKERFATKPTDPKYGKKSYLVLAVAFSPDGTCLAVGQSDHVVFVYRIGAEWSEKKVIINKLVQTAATKAIEWPFDDKIIIGMTDGKVRVGLLKQNKCASLYKTDADVVALATSPKKTSFVSAHIDGSIIIYSFSTKSQVKLCTHPCAAYSLVFTAHCIVAAGADRRVICYAESGMIQQQFDFSSVDEKDFSAIATDPTGQNFVLGSYDRIRLFSWNAKRVFWEEGTALEMDNLYAVTTLSWKPDGTTIYCGNVCGGVIAIDCSLKKKMLRDRFETTYIGPSHLVIRDVTTEHRTHLVSRKGLAIEDIKMMGGDGYVIAYTATTLIIADMESGKSSEIDWLSGGNEKFYFDSPNACLIVNVGEVTVVEYGREGGPVGWVRTEQTAPALLSVRLAERGVRAEEPARKIAYLLDPSTISIMNLANGVQQTSFTHINSIDWLELNETATKLLFRDKRQRVHIADLSGPPGAEPKTTNLLAFCTYCQWVPSSDVIVAQSADQLYIWYNPDHPEQMQTVPIKGDVEGVLRDQERTEVIVQESTAKVAYELDNTQIEFGTALENLDLERAVTFLERSPGTSDELYSMWLRVGELALTHQRLLIAQRCFAAIGDVARVNMLQESIELADEAAERLGGDGTQAAAVRANLAKMLRRFKEAETIYLEQNNIEEVIKMYQTLHRWDDALEIAKTKNYPGYEQLKASYYRTLFDSGQEEKAAQLKAVEGDKTAAVQLYIQSNRPVQALELVLADQELMADDTLCQSIAVSLLKNQLFEKAGTLFEHLKDFERAMESYRNGKAFANAIQLARFSFPERVLELEEEWGDFLVKEGQPDAAINHYLESNATVKAIEAAIQAKEYNKAVQIVDVIQDEEVAKKYYGEIATYYSDTEDLERAERYFLEAGLANKAVEMYLKHNKWKEAFKISYEFFGKEETLGFYERRAEEMAESGRFADAEQCYIAIGQSIKAVQMYRAAGRNEDVIRLVEEHHGEKLSDTHKQLGHELETKGETRAAEEAYLRAGDFQSAINMYRELDQWSDAYRLAKAEGSENLQKQIGYQWAKSLGGEAAVKLLNRNNILQDSITHACETGAYDFAFELARLGSKDRLPEVHARFARLNEDEGDFETAAKNYIAAGKPHQAVEMFLSDQDWANAEKIATEFAREMLPDVYREQSRQALEQGDFPRAESLLLRAGEPERILQYYKATERWPDALRIAKEYLPNQLEQIQEDFDKAQLRSGARGVESYLAQAHEWETQSEWARAVQCYMKVTPEATSDDSLVKQSTLKATDLTMKFLIGRVDEQILEQLLMQLDQYELHEKAAELQLALGNHREAIIAYCRARQWSKAKEVASESLPFMLEEIEAAYKESLKQEGKLGELINVDVVSAIDLMVERGQWEKALETARQQKHKPLLEKYVAKYAAELLRQEPPDGAHRAAELFLRYGASANPANNNMYKVIFNQIIWTPVDSPLEQYTLLASIRNLFLLVVEEQLKESVRTEEDFSRFQWSAHFLSLHTALSVLESSPEVEKLKLKLLLSLLRYTDIILPDVAFYRAGMAAREYGEAYSNVAYVLLNHFLDIADAIEENDPSLVNTETFEGTDIPASIALPSRLSVSIIAFLKPAELDDVKEWVLAMTVDEGASQVLLEDGRGVFECSLSDQTGRLSKMCVVSGYPVLGAPVNLGNNLLANRADLNSFILVLKTNPTDQLHDSHAFLSTAAKQQIALSL